jgi:peroxiredoxin Q/BCP
MLTEQMQAPHFKLMGNDGQSHSLSSLQGKLVIIYFYPKDNTPGCTQEACDFRDSLSEFKQKGIQVFGISKDSIASHQKFIDKFDLNFILLSDPELKTHKDYYVLDQNKTIRSTFLIDKKGKINKIWQKVKVSGHINEILKSLENL